MYKFLRLDESPVFLFDLWFEVYPAGPDHITVLPPVTESRMVSPSQTGLFDVIAALSCPDTLTLTESVFRQPLDPVTVTL